MATKTLIEHMNISLADTYVVLMKTQDVHWNYTVSNFYGMHKMTQAQYEDMFEGIDEMAERIRAKGHPAPSGMSVYHQLTTVAHDQVTLLNTAATCQHLIDANQALCKTLAKTVHLAEKERDTATADMWTMRITQQESFIWMLNATISGSD